MNQLADMGNSLAGFLRNPASRMQYAGRADWLLRACGIGIIAGSMYGFAITSHALTLLRAMPGVSLLGIELSPSTVASGFAALVHGALAVLYMAFARARREDKPAILGFLVVAAVFAIFAGFLSVHANMNGERYRNALANRIGALSSAIDSDKHFMASTVQASVDSLRNLAEASRRGADKTGIAKCGSLCAGYFDRASQLASRYGHLLGKSDVGPQTDGDLVRQYNVLLAAHADFVNRAGAFAEFLAAERVPVRFERNPAYERELAQLGSYMATGRHDELSLALSSLVEVSWWDPRIVIALIIALLPELLNLGFAVSMSALQKMYDVPFLTGQKGPRGAVFNEGLHNEEVIHG